MPQSASSHKVRIFTVNLLCNMAFADLAASNNAPPTTASALTESNTISLVLTRMSETTATAHISAVTSATLAGPGTTNLEYVFNVLCYGAKIVYCVNI